MTLTVNKLSEFLGYEVNDPDEVLSDIKRVEFENDMEIVFDKTIKCHIVRVQLSISASKATPTNAFHGGEKMVIEISDEYGEMEVYEIK